MRLRLLLAPLCLLALLPVGCTPPAPPASPSQTQEHGRTDDRSSRGERREQRREERREDRGDDRADNRGSYRDDDDRRDGGAAQAGGGGRAPRARPTNATPGTFDFYLLTLSWSPEFCATHSAAAECAAHAGFVLHGLWPQNNDATYPEHCSDAPGPANPAQYSDIFPDASLLEHEWTTHGTCSGLSPDAYFQLARRAYQSVRTPPQLNALTQGTSEPPDTILSEFASLNTAVPRGSLALSCGSNYLTAVQVCLAKDLSATACEVRTCRANTVRIVPRGGGQ